jgi:hypothetical protein
MDLKKLGDDAPAIAQEILGYLNFSSGVVDVRFLKNFSELFGRIAAHPSRKPTWRVLGDWLQTELMALRGTSEAFREVEQAEAILHLVFQHALPAYYEFHHDLLFHQTEASLFQPFFIGRVCEAVLQQGGPWDQVDRIIPAVLRQLNDYLGHRPVAVLHTDQKIQPYAHEWVRPIPLWIRGAGVAPGPYQELIQTALSIIESTSPSLLFEAMFNLEQLDEVALDPRAYDFDHPVNKRPNYLFGQWDLAHLDNSGRSRRFVLQQVSLDAMLDRLNHRGERPREQILFEEAAVLAGTMLMGSGVSGDRPDAHDSTVSLATLVQRIALYRDAFYEQLLGRMSGRHVELLRAEAKALRQPFGGARQHFNHYLAQRRALQLQHVHLAQLFASMGYTEAAERQAQVVPVASARMSCDIRCRLTTAHLAIEQGRLEDAAAQVRPIEQTLHRAIECGALVDPWNILGFGAQFSLFPAVENSVYDHRIDELLNLMSGIFSLHVEISRAAAASGNIAIHQAAIENLAALTRWWDKFASTEVPSVESISGLETLASAEQVAFAIHAWHEAGTAAGDVGFWRQHVEEFASPKAFALVIETLLDRRDPVAAMALLVQWLSQADAIPLVEEDFSFHDLALVWMEDLWRDAISQDHIQNAAETKSVAKAADKTTNKPADTATGESTPSQKEASVKSEKSEKIAAPASRDLNESWRLARKFLDYLEANAEEYGHVPQFEVAPPGTHSTGPMPEMEMEEEEEEEEDEEDSLFGAAYEGVTYRDTTDDGVEGEIFDVGQSTSDFELVNEAERIIDRLGFFSTLAQLWRLVAMSSANVEAADREDTLAGWLQQAMSYDAQLLQLLNAVQGYRIPQPRGTHESLVEYDRRRGVKEMLLDEIIDVCVEMSDASRIVRANMKHPPKISGQAAWEALVGDTFAAVFRGDAAAVRKSLPDLLRELRKQPVLYVALARGGKPHRIVTARGLQSVLRRLLTYLPRLGLLTETCRLLETAQKMELEHSAGPGAITEFDRVFEIACRGITSCLIESSAGWRKKSKTSTDDSDNELIDYLERVVEVLLRCWLLHSRGVRLSVLEVVGDNQRWKLLKQFIEQYGSDLFTQRFMNLGNLRGILHQGVEAYLESLQEDPDSEESYRLITELDGAITREEAAYWLGIVIEAVVENYGEYIDYNSITTQSDRGEMLYTLLDFLRLRASYDRLAWNLRPVMLAHEILVRCGRDQAADIWRQAVAERTAVIAADHLKQFERLTKTYGMRLPSIADHLGERFLRPLEIDQLCSLVRPAVEELRRGQEPEAFRRLEKLLAKFTTEASGAGFELPSWLDALEHEAEQAQWQTNDVADGPSDLYIRQVRLSRREAERQLKQIFNEAEEW